MLTIAAQMANLIHIRVTFNAVTRYSLILALQYHLSFKHECNKRQIAEHFSSELSQKW